VRPCVCFCVVTTWALARVMSPSWLPCVQANRAHTYLGKREAEWHETQNEEDIYPDFVTMAKAFGVPSRRVIKKSELRSGMYGVSLMAGGVMIMGTYGDSVPGFCSVGWQLHLVVCSELAPSAMLHAAKNNFWLNWKPHTARPVHLRCMWACHHQSHLAVPNASFLSMQPSLLSGSAVLCCAVLCCADLSCLQPCGRCLTLRAPTFWKLWCHTSSTSCQ
jgi:hypothetical protein